MFNSNVLWILAAFVVYMGVMIAIGAKYMKSTKNSEDYFLGGRGLSGWVAALSAQASDMSGWLLMCGICIWNRSGMDCYWTVYWNGLQLDIYFRKTAQIYHPCQ